MYNKTIIGFGLSMISKIIQTSVNVILRLRQITLTEVWIILDIMLIHSSIVYSMFLLVDRAKEVEDSLCVGYKNSSNEERVVLFLKMANGFKYVEFFWIFILYTGMFYLVSNLI